MDHPIDWEKVNEQVWGPITRNLQKCDDIHLQQIADKIHRMKEHNSSDCIYCYGNWNIVSHDSKKRIELYNRAKQFAKSKNLNSEKALQLVNDAERLLAEL